MRVFNEKTISALKSHSHIEQPAVEGTVKFLTVILALRKIISNKEIKGDERH